MTNDGKHKNAIILLIDGLNPAFLSPHGCVWIDTPAIDQLASESILFERAVTESVDPNDAARSFLQGRHPLSWSTGNDRPSTLLKTSRDQGIGCILLTDQQELNFVSDGDFDQVIQLPVVPLESALVSASEIGETHLARCFAATLSELPKQASPFVCLVHLTSLTKIWDAPLSMREKHRDEDDPEALEIVKPPRQQGDFDPDEILGVTQAYAAQLESFDTCLDVFLEELRLDGMFENSMLVLAGLRGFPMGHQKQMGHDAAHLTSDATCVPLMFRLPDNDQERFPAMRTHELTSISEWLDYVVDWLSGDGSHRFNSIVEGVEKQTKPDSRANSRAVAVVCGVNARAIWTQAWLLVERNGELRLFVKPDDRWDINPVQDRCRRIAEDLSKILDDACAKLHANQYPSFDLLADELVFGLE